MKNDLEILNNRLINIGEKFTKQFNATGKRLTNIEICNLQIQQKLDEMIETLKLIPKLCDKVDKVVGII